MGNYYEGRLPGTEPPRGTIWNSCYLRESGERHRLIYAHSSNADEEDLLGKMYYPSNNDFPTPVLINEGMSENMTSYYERARDRDPLGRGDLLLFRKRLLGKRARKRLLLGEGTRGLLGQ